MADRWRSVLVATVAATVLALPANATAKPHAKRACQAATKAGKKQRCRARAQAQRPRSRGTDPEHVAPAVIIGDGPATRAGEVLEV